jgi:hypothetical protein
MDNETYEAVVIQIVPNGTHGPYAVAKHPKLVGITFSLRHPVWEEEIFPDEGSIVMLSKITRKRAGWRANSGRFFQPSDGQPTTERS